MLAARRAAVLEAENAHRRVERDLAKTVIRSPVAGVVVRRQVEVGTAVADLQNGGTVVATLADDSRIHVLAQVDENDVARAAAAGRLAGEDGVWDLLARRLQAIPEYVALFDAAKVKRPADLDARLRGLSLYAAQNALADSIRGAVCVVTGPRRADDPDGPGEFHVILLDNGRSALAESPHCRDALRCIKCGACANVCPVYQTVGGHVFGHIYIGAIGIILTAFYHGLENAAEIVRACIGCRSCVAICPSKIDLEEIIRQRLDDRPESSYTARLAAGGEVRMAQKVGEEGVEFALAAVTAEPAPVAGAAGAARSGSRTSCGAGAPGAVPSGIVGSGVVGSGVVGSGVVSTGSEPGTRPSPWEGVTATGSPPPNLQAVTCWWCWRNRSTTSR